MTVHRILLFVTLVLGVSLSTDAAAWKCKRHPSVGALSCPADCLWWPGNSAQFQFRYGDFHGSNEKPLIQAAAYSWNAGSGERLRGADWEFTFGSDVSSMEFENDRNEIARVDFSDASLKDVGLPKSMRDEVLDGPLAFAVPEITRWPNCQGVVERDILFDKSVKWSHTPTLNGEYLDAYDDTSGQYIGYLGRVAAHEFGHVIGFAHHTPDVNLMDDYGNENGEFHELPSPDEDNLLGLQAAKPHSSTGINVAVSPWYTPKPTEYYPADPSVLSTLPAWEALSGEESPATPFPLPQGVGFDPASGSDVGTGAPRFVSLSTSDTGWFPVEFWLVPASAVTEGFTPPFSPCSTYAATPLPLLQADDEARHGDELLPTPRDSRVLHCVSDRR